MKKLWVICIFILLACCGVDNCFGEDAEHVFAIQKKMYHRYHELGLDAGYIPDDDFFEVFPVGLYYNYNFNDLITWQVVRGHWMFTAEKDLKEDLENDFGATPSKFFEPEYAVHSNFMIRPLYGKSAFRNRRIINHETYLYLGGGFVGYDKRFSDGSSETDIAPSISLGIGQKIFLNEKFCLNVEVRDWINFRDNDTENNFWVGLSLGFRFNLSARKTERDTTVEHLNQYLRERKNHE
jgi:outer membrane beta-barrel protein